MAVCRSPKLTREDQIDFLKRLLDRVKSGKLEITKFVAERDLEILPEVARDEFKRYRMGMETIHLTLKPVQSCDDLSGAKLAR